MQQQIMWSLQHAIDHVWKEYQKRQDTKECDLVGRSSQLYLDKSYQQMNPPNELVNVPNEHLNFLVEMTRSNLLFDFIWRCRFT